MDKKNSGKFILLILTGIILGILIYQYVVPPLEQFFFSQIKLKQPPISLEKPSVEKETKIICQRQERGKVIEVNLQNQKLRICENGQALKEMVISSGKEDSPTPTGSFRVINKSLMIYSKIADCWLPFWIGFSPDGKYGFHEVPICQKEEGRTGVTEIGQPVSLGCIRLNVGDAETLYKWVEIGTLVIIY